MYLDLTCQSQLYLGLFEYEIQGWLKRFSVHARTAIDIGAAAGEYSLFFLKKTQVEKVFAFEPSEPDRQQFLSNLWLNGLSEDTRLEVYSVFAGAQMSDGVLPLDTLLPKIALPVVVKMDVDGAEKEVLCGARQLLDLPQVRWIIETHTPALEDDCVSILQSAGYEVRIVPNAWWRIILPELRVAAHRPENHNRWLVAARPEDASVF